MGQTYHGDNLCLHLPDAREHVWVDRVRDGEFAKGLGLEAYQLFAAVVYGTADSSILPACVFHLGQLV